MRKSFAVGVVIVVIAACGGKIDNGIFGTSTTVDYGHDGGATNGSGPAGPTDFLVTDAGPPTEDTCAPPTIASLVDGQCHAITHLPDPRSLFHGAYVGDVVVINNAVASTDTGAFAGRPANADPTKYEVLDGIGFVVISQQGLPAIGVWTFDSLTVNAGVSIQISGAPSAMLATRKESRPNPAARST
jgi:hypothetical protein